MTVRPEVVVYLNQNLGKYSIEPLRQQLISEGVAEEDIEDSLGEVLKTRKQEVKSKPAGRRAALFLMAAGALVIIGVGLFAVSQKSSRSASAAPAADASGPDGEAYVSPSGWVVRLPRNYKAVSEFKDSAKSDELVHFCPVGTDPTSFLNEDLFGQLGIVRMEVSPSPFSDDGSAQASLQDAVTRKLTSRGDKFTIKPFSVETLTGFQVAVQTPFPRVEAYLLGRKMVYFLYGGQDDDVWRDILMSLRDTRPE